MNVDFAPVRLVPAYRKVADAILERILDLQLVDLDQLRAPSMRAIEPALRAQRLCQRGAERVVATAGVADRKDEPARAHGASGRKRPSPSRGVWVRVLRVGVGAP